MAAEKLAHTELAHIAWELPAQIGFKPDQIELFAGSNRRRVIKQIAH